MPPHANRIKFQCSSFPENSVAFVLYDDDTLTCGIINKDLENADSHYAFAALSQPDTQRLIQYLLRKQPPLPR